MAKDLHSSLFLWWTNALMVVIYLVIYCRTSSLSSFIITFSNLCNFLKFRAVELNFLLFSWNSKKQHLEMCQFLYHIFGNINIHHFAFFQVMSPVLQDFCNFAYRRVFFNIPRLSKNFHWINWLKPNIFRALSLSHSL